MNFNFNDSEQAEEYFRPEAGKRYNLTVSAAKDAVSKVKQTPFLKLSFQTDAMLDAYSKDIYNTPKAMFRAQEWFKALGLKTDGDVNFEPADLVGIKLTAKCTFETYETDEADGSKKEHRMVRWEDPLPVKVGSAAPRAAAPAPRPAAAPYVPTPIDETVPF